MANFDPSFGAARQQYEDWLRCYCALDEQALVSKRAKVADNPLGTLRGCFFRWLGILKQLPAAVREGPRLLSVGDLHLENFGTWRDAEGRLVWGINDFDEAGALPFTSDLLRLATSVRLDATHGKLGLKPKAALDALLRGYRQGLAEAPAAFVLESTNPGLRALADIKPLEVAERWAEYAADVELDPDSLPGRLRQALLDSLPPGTKRVRFHRRESGLGSLGRPRVVALGWWQDGEVAREAKAAAPSALRWPRDSIAEPLRDYRRILRHSAQRRDPTLRLTRRWVIRRLSPEARKIGLSKLNDAAQPRALLVYMARELGRLHHATAGGGELLMGALDALPGGWLGTAAKQAEGLVLADWEAAKSDA